MLAYTYMLVGDELDLTLEFYKFLDLFDFLPLLFLDLGDSNCLDADF